MWHQTTPESLLCTFFPISPTLLGVHLPNSAWCPSPQLCLVSISPTLLGAHLPNSVWCPSPQLCLVSISPTLLGVHLPNSAWCWHLGSLNLTLQGACISEKSANTKNQGVFSSFQAAGNETFPSIHWLFPPRLR